MAKVTANIATRDSWVASDRAQLRIGDPGAASLADSAGGGARLDEQAVGALAGQAGQTLALEAAFAPKPQADGASGKCAIVPVGVTLADAAGNPSSPVFETFVQLQDPPAAPASPTPGNGARPDIAPSSGGGAAVLTWKPSPDLPTPSA